VTETTPTYRTRDCDVLVLGGGLAAMRAAIEARNAGRDVLMLNRGKIGRSGSSALTGTGFAAVFPEWVPEDSLTAHLEDTIRGGAFVNDLRLAQVMVEESPARLLELMGYGVELDADGDDGVPSPRPSGEHSFPRVYVTRAHRGLGMTLPERSEADRLGIAMCENTLAVELLLTNGEVGGVVAVDRVRGELLAVRARQTILATGGAGRLFFVTSNPRDVIGTSFALGFVAGATLVDMEFVQFYPWRLLAPVGRDTRIPVQPTTFVMGGRLYNTAGERFAEALDPERAEATTRDLAARGIFEQSRRGLDYDGGVRLDISDMSDDDFARCNPRIAEVSAGRWSIRDTLMTVTPEAHFCMGGLRIDEHGRTDVGRLLAAGESAGGVHGGNRLNANAMAETQVFGRRAGLAAAEASRCASLPPVDQHQVERIAERLAALAGPTATKPAELVRTLRQEMWAHVGIVREAAGLNAALARIDALAAEARSATAESLADRLEIVELEQMLTAARLIARAALERRESRGAHFRDDFPEQDDTSWLANIRLRRAAGDVRLEAVPLSPDRLELVGAGAGAVPVAGSAREFSE
jgi:fumarate reductase (CoM/CoB) subunit A